MIIYNVHNFLFRELIFSSTKQQRLNLTSHTYIRRCGSSIRHVKQQCVLVYVYSPVMVVFKAQWIVLPGGELRSGPLYVLVEGQKIASIHEDAPGLPDEVINTHLLTPGFVDLHTHGLGEFRSRLLFFHKGVYDCMEGISEYCSSVYSRSCCVFVYFNLEV